MASDSSVFAAGERAPQLLTSSAVERHLLLAGGWVWDIVGRLTRFVQPSDNSRHLLLFHVCTNDTTSEDLEHIKHDYLALEVMVKSMAVQVVSPRS